MTPSSVASITLLAVLAGTSVGAQTPDGTYQFQVTSPDGAEVVARGQFVLTSIPFQLSQLSPDVLERVRSRSRWLLPQRNDSATACFGFEESLDYVGDREFYGGIIPAGASNWHVDEGRVLVHVYQSPDASQYLAGKLRDGRLEGSVLQRDFDLRGPIEWLPFVAERMGDATSESCESVVRSGQPR